MSPPGDDLGGVPCAAGSYSGAQKVNGAALVAVEVVAAAVVPAVVELAVELAAALAVELAAGLVPVALEPAALELAALEPAALEPAAELAAEPAGGGLVGTTAEQDAWEPAGSAVLEFGASAECVAFAAGSAVGC